MTYFKYIWLKNTDPQASSLSLSDVLAKLLAPSSAQHFDFTNQAALRFFLELIFSTDSVEVTFPCLRDLKQLERKQECPSKA